MKIGKIIKDARLHKGMSQEDLAKRIGVSRAAVSKWESDESLPTRKHFPKVTEILGVSLDVIHPLENKNIKTVDLHSDYKDTAVLQKDQIDIFLSNNQMVAVNDQNTLKISKNYPDDVFATYVTDDSMSPIFNRDEIIVISPSTNPKNNDYILAKVINENDFILRKYLYRGQNLQGDDVFDLQPDNPNHPTITVSDSTKVQIIGKVIEHRRLF